MKRYFWSVGNIKGYSFVRIHSADKLDIGIEGTNTLGECRFIQFICQENPYYTVGMSRPDIFDLLRECLKSKERLW